MSRYDIIKKSADAKALKNRQNRVQKKADKYKGGKLSKTQKSYIAGDIVSSASTRAYGYKKYGMQGDSYITEKGRSKKNQAKINRGENPYELKYVYDGVARTVPGGTRADGSKYGSFTSRKRRLTDEEKQAYKKTGDINVDKYNQKYKYSLMSSYNRDPKKFRDNLNTNKWDGMEVAKNKGGGLNYVAGLAKDVILDPVVDVMKGVDYLSGIATGALAGGLEESKNAIEALATGDMSKVDFKRSFKNAKESIESSNKTGWGKSMGDYFNDAAKRNTEREIAYLESKIKSIPKSERTPEVLAYYQKLIDDSKKTLTDKKHQMFRNLAGFIGDIAMPIDAGASIGKVFKGATKNTTKSFKEMVEGTADISTAFTPDKGRMQEALNKYAQRRKSVKPSDGKFIDNIFHETKPMNDLKIYDEDSARKLRNTLDNGYNTQMANDVKQVVKSNPTTQNLGKFLDNIEPVQKSPIVDDFETIFEASDVPNSKLGKEIFFKKIDNLPDDESDEILDWLAEYNPKIYDEYLSASDDVSRFTDDAPISNFIKDSYTKKHDEGRINDLNYNLAKPSHIKNEQLNTSYNQKNLENILNGSNKYVSTSRLPVKDLKKKFSDRGQEFANNLPNYDVDKLKSLSKTLNNMSNITSNVKASKVIDELNHKVFGANVIRNNLSISGLNQIVEHLEDLVNYNIAKKSGEFKVQLRTKDGIKTHYLTDRNGNPNPFPNQFHLLAPSATDEMFDKKLSDIATYFGVKNKNVFTDPLKKYEKLLKDGTGLSPEQYEDYMKLKSRVDEWGKMYSKVKNLDYDSYNNYAKKNYKNSDVYEELLKDTSKGKNKLTYDDFYNETIDEIEKSGKNFDNLPKGVSIEDVINDIASQKYKSYLDEIDSYKLKEHVNNRNVSIKEDGTLSQSPRVEQENLNEVGEVLDLSNKERFVYQTLELRNKLKLPVVEPTKAKIKLSKGQKLRDIPPVKESLKHLRTTIEKELEMMYKNGSEYEKVKDSFTQIKKDYVNALRSYGVPDDKYFHKVKALQDDLKMYYKELQKPSSIIKKDGYKPSGGKPREGIRMNLQLLAEKISNTFDEIDNNVIDDVVEKIETFNKNNIDEFSNGFDEFNQTENIKELKRNPVDTSDKVKKKSNKPSVEEIDAILERINKTYGESSNPTPLDNAIKKEKPTPLDNAIKKEKPTPSDNVIKKENPTPLDNAIKKEKPPTFDEFKKFFTDKEDTHMKYEDSKLYGVYKSWLNSWKKGVTVYNPGWHVQNFFQNKGQNYLALGSDALGSQKDARNILKEIKGKPNKANHIIDKKNYKAYSPQEIAKLAIDNNVIDGLGEDIQSARGVLKPIENAIDNSRLMKKLNESEETARLHHFIKQLERGMSPEEASKSVNKYLFDYGDKSKFDKVVSDFVDPFWMFHKNNARLLTQVGIENPGKASNIVRASSNLENGLDEKDENKTRGDKYQSLVGSFKDEKNKDTYDYLYKENMFPSIEDAIPLERNDLETKLNPIIRIALEQSRGEGAFGNKIVDKEEASWGEVTKDDRFWEVIKDLNPVGSPLIKAYISSKERQEKADKGKQSQETSDKQALLDWINYITGNKGNYYRNLR